MSVQVETLDKLERRITLTLLSLPAMYAAWFRVPRQPVN